MACLFGFSNYTKPGKGITEQDLNKTGIALYFDILGRRFWKLLLLNLFFIISSIPAIIINYAITSFLLIVLLNISGASLTQSEISLLQLFFTAILLLFSGSGSSSAAMSYVLRKYVNDTHSWVWSDFVDNFKSNFIQGTLSYIINITVISLILLGLIFYYFVLGGVMGVIFTAILSVFGVIFLMVQMYIYPIMSGFQLKIKDIYKNAFIFTIVNLPFNVLTLLISVIFMILISSIIHTMFSLLVLILCFYSLTIYTQIFMTNNVVKKYLEEPAIKAIEENNQ